MAMAFLFSHLVSWCPKIESLVTGLVMHVTVSERMTVAAH